MLKRGAIMYTLDNSTTKEKIAMKVKAVLLRNEDTLDVMLNEDGSLAIFNDVDSATKACVVEDNSEYLYYKGQNVELFHIYIVDDIF